VSDPGTGGAPRRRRVEGVGSLLAAVYALFAVAAGARSLFQIVSKFDEAPVAYVLSAAAALIYLAAAVCFARPSGVSYRAALVFLAVELAGVLVVGALSLADEDLFPDQTVWSDFGAGYGFIPLVLPVAGLAWLVRGRTRREWEDAGT
jgi:hypothetical protein